MEPGQSQSSVPASGTNPHGGLVGGLPAPERIAFTGAAGEYFGIWLANTVLSILTLGIFSAWAKVRRNRYFLGNTAVLGDGLEYHATGMMILKGRLIALAVIVAYSAVGAASPTAQGIAAIALIPLYPWVINRSLKFRARMTSWRNVRLDWHGEYWGVAKVTLLWPLIAVLTLGALGPMAARAGREYLANHYALGRTRFAATTRLAPYYGALLHSVIFFVISALIWAGLMAAIFTSIGSANAAAGDVGTFSIWHWIVIVLVVWSSVVLVYFRILARNIIISALTLGDAATFQSNLSPLRYLWILLSNFFVTVFTMFMMYPWAQIRSYRYQAECVTVAPAIEVAAFLDTETRAGRAFGEEFGEIEGIDIGI